MLENGVETFEYGLLDNGTNTFFYFRAVDPHGLSRGRKLSVRGSTAGDHQLNALAEDPEDDRNSDSETETLSTSPRVTIVPLRPLYT